MCFLDSCHYFGDLTNSVTRYVSACVVVHADEYCQIKHNLNFTNALCYIMSNIPFSWMAFHQPACHQCNSVTRQITQHSLFRVYSATCKYLNLSFTIHNGKFMPMNSFPAFHWRGNIKAIWIPHWITRQIAYLAVVRNICFCCDFLQTSRTKRNILFRIEDHNRCGSILAALWVGGLSGFPRLNQ